MMAYLDWDRAEDNRVNASFVANSLDSNQRGPGEVFKRAEEDTREQQLLYSKM
jgi:hypothetical protein